MPRCPDVNVTVFVRCGAGLRTTLLAAVLAVLAACAPMTAPPGPATGLDQTAVVYLRVNPP